MTSMSFTSVITLSPRSTTATAGFGLNDNPPSARPYIVQRFCA
jgi:hypothetical protein